MHRSSLVILVLALTALLLSGCPRQGLTPEKDLHDALGLFVQSLRWGDAPGSARFFVDPHGQDFLERYRDRDELNITDVFLNEVHLSPERDQAQVRLRVEYFLLPSASVRRADIEQHWRMLPGGIPGPQSWRIHSAFPDLY
ncbi:hypothetical protein [Geoalkalibacter halelectricus]|uniref:Uncharacterized protein n=1 Tax=Geoalkalibacter halelectricus TaxID=2847045 RepID=A0ABY5ZGY8_9BACT|nr:hypothetical protein [Geoalkalibacter halelectricus]MDO3378034.1 hypothetical protein [Geoalkalibacter halelectricus]UWZ78333.1 hypothetical protein L9S41_11595 [Geoalkalibacter halelectricus]